MAGTRAAVEEFDHGSRVVEGRVEPIERVEEGEAVSDLLGRGLVGVDGRGLLVELLLADLRERCAKIKNVELVERVGRGRDRDLTLERIDFDDVARAGAAIDPIEAAARPDRDRVRARASLDGVVAWAESAATGVPGLWLFDRNRGWIEAHLVRQRAPRADALPPIADTLRTAEPT